MNSVEKMDIAAGLGGRILVDTADVMGLLEDLENMNVLKIQMLV